MIPTGTALAATGLGDAFLLIWLAALVFAVYVIVDMARRPGWVWKQAGSSKVLWLVLEIVFVLGFISVLIGILYLATIRPKLEAVGRQGPVAPPWPSGPAWPAQDGWPAGPPQAPPFPSAAGPPAGGPPAYPQGAPSPPGMGLPAGGPPAYPGAVAETPRPTFGWYPDPSGAHEQRYWDGTTWTEHVSDGDQRSIDPLPN